MASLPAPIRAGLGLLATALDTVQELVEHAPEIPMEAVGNSMQLSMRLQQHYVALLTRGDEFIASLRGAPEEPPAWATFDDLPPTAAPGSDPADGDLTVGDLTVGDLDSDRAIFDDVVDIPAAELQDEPRQAGQGDPLFDAATTALEATAGAGAAATKAPGTKVPAKELAAKKVAAKKAPAEKIAAKKVAAKKVPAKKVPAKKVPAKKIGAERIAASTGPRPAQGDELPASTKAPAKRAAKRATKTADGAPAHAPAPTLTTAAAPVQNPPAAGRKAVAKKAGKRVPRSVAPRAVLGTGVAESGVGGLDAGLESSAHSFTVPPQLNVALGNGDASARPRSAFDLAETPIDDVAARESAGTAALADPAAEAGPSAPGSSPGV